MNGPAILVAILAACALFVSARIHSRGRALRTRGVRVSAICINKANGKSGTVSLLVRHTSPAGAVLHFDLGPFTYPPANIGGTLQVIYDPQDPTNSEIPDRITKGRVSLGFAMLFTGIILLCLFMIAASV
jgi:hypothetical protein